MAGTIIACQLALTSLFPLFPHSIGSDPAAGFKLPGGLAKEHVEMVLAPPSEGKASNATVIARAIHDAPALLNGMPLPVSHAELDTCHSSGLASERGSFRRSRLLRPVYNAGGKSVRRLAI
jgi:hypothetical protein